MHLEPGSSPDSADCLLSLSQEFIRKRSNAASLTFNIEFYVYFSINTAAHTVFWWENCVRTTADLSIFLSLFLPTVFLQALADNANDEILQYLLSYAVVFQKYRTAVMGSLGWKENAHGVVVDVEAKHIDLWRYGIETGGGYYRLIGPISWHAGSALTHRHVGLSFLKECQHANLSTGLQEYRGKITID